MGQITPPKVSRSLAASDLRAVRPFTDAVSYHAGDLVFTEGDEADFIYFIESGRVSVFLNKFTVRQELCVLGQGDYFGEMAVLNRGKRSASVSALEDSVLLRADRASFHRLLETNPGIRNAVYLSLDKRSQELSLQEMLVDSFCAHNDSLHVSIKGDPSLRESVFSRERYVSVVDPLLQPLCGQLDEILQERCVFCVSIHFNSGEVATSSIFDPFCEDIHVAGKLLDPAYVDRHFPKVDYNEKVAAIKQLYGHISRSDAFSSLSDNHLILHGHLISPWEPLSPEEISTTLSKMPTLRQIPNLFLRNIKINVTRNAIRMQFNCDGTHIVSTADYLRFIEDNLMPEQPQH